MHHVTSRMSSFGLLLALTAAGCSDGFFPDPVFESVGAPSEATTGCVAGSTCVEVPLIALVEAAGRDGRCAIHRTPGDPATMEPLVSERVTVPPADGEELSIAFTWTPTVPGDVDVAELNPVCSPMIEG